MKESDIKSIKEFEAGKVYCIKLDIDKVEEISQFEDRIWDLIKPLKKKDRPKIIIVPRNAEISERKE